MNSRKGIKIFTSQVSALKYFTNTIIDAANRGWFRTDEVKNLFKRELEGWGSGSAENIRRREDSGSDHCVGWFWGLVCLPILSFFEGVNTGGDNTTYCDFTTSIEYWKKVDFIEGTLTWRSQGTRDRFIHLVFSPQGGAKMFYDLGDGYDHEVKDYVPRKESSFLGLPTEGDEVSSVMSHKEFLALAKAAQ
jgi:hypothetical protein